ncbi:uncharacterized protein LOC128389817 [Panonychus citri]|uniref:uncharacterized protein LOC128389817 n=1 Tax=Panonychus citri TaxID=50023 RepID=UPI002307DE8E|nr:uncharacterized protein LOC128389817 [Panonychus citri]XP_053205424.1 uncharacterized protein LOC128389817 [Panonychus citri]XP_053205425.1 uncharacterized protein LOC128389817 [Panonychus citri]
MESTFPIKAKTICRSLISSWSNLPLQEINVESVSNGRSNRLFICSRSSATSSDLTTEPKSSSVGSGQPVACSSTGHHDENIDSSKSGQVDRYSKVIVRFYGSEFTGEGNQYKCVSDDEEMEILKILSARGISPAVLKSFPGGRIDEYIESTILDPKRIAQIDILTILAPKIAQYHVTRFKCEKVYDLVQICRDNITKATEILSNYTETRLADYSEPTALLLRKVKQFYMDKPATRLIEKMTLIKQKNVFAH